MKKALPLIFLGTIAIAMSVSSCIKKVIDPTENSYTCNCTYVHGSPTPLDSTTHPNITESSTVKGINTDDAKLDCSELQSKYYNQNYNGTCIIQ